MPPGISTVRRERRGRVLIVRIDREAKRNAIDRVTTGRIDEALNLLDRGLLREARAALDWPLTGGVGGHAGRRQGPFGQNEFDLLLLRLVDRDGLVACWHQHF